MTKAMGVGVLFSGGKDSCLALHKFGKENVNCLMSVIPRNVDSFMFHKPSCALLKRQAEMLGLPLITEASEGKKEEELSDLRKLIRKSNANAVVVGGIRSNYQGERIKRLCSEIGAEVIAPILNYSAERLWQELLENRFRIVITKISCEGISKDFIGRIIDEKALDELKKLSERHKFALDFEGGEAETAVLHMPGFKKEISIDYEIKSEGEHRHFMVLKKAR